MATAPPANKAREALDVLNNSDPEPEVHLPMANAVLNGLNGGSIRSGMEQYEYLNRELGEAIGQLNDLLLPILNRVDPPTADKGLGPQSGSDLGEWIARNNATYHERIDAIRFLMERVDL